MRKNIFLYEIPSFVMPDQQTENKPTKKDKIQKYKDKKTTIKRPKKATRQKEGPRWSEKVSDGPR